LSAIITCPRASWAGHDDQTPSSPIKKLETTDMSLDSLEDDPDHRTPAFNGATNSFASREMTRIKSIFLIDS